ncbi:hypothetical protein [Oceanirhabdus sp. W0125-5]|nr:hypothetical protein [Oceanirhabdus sp. W0125-5]WBW96664.1 hypothetical protein OW730_23670 [Oceanirhabdus sp. W0125-5]
MMRKLMMITVGSIWSLGTTKLTKYMTTMLLTRIDKLILKCVCK